jgi:hypothetical protein
MQHTFLLALLVKPLVSLVVFGLICLPARLAVMRFMREGRLKRLLLHRIHDRY